MTEPNDAVAWAKIILTPIRPVRYLRSPVAGAVADLTNAGEVLLEAGCGSATLSAELATVGRVIELCDFSKHILARASMLFAASGLPPPRLTACDLTKRLPWPDRAVDVVWSSGVLEHWTDDELLPIISEMNRISRRCVISLVPNARCVLYRLGKHLAEQQQNWPYGREIPRQTLRQVFERAGLSNVREQTLLREWAAKMLRLTDPRMEQLVGQWWNSLAPTDSVMDNQGYLLLTVGDVSSP